MIKAVISTLTLLLITTPTWARPGLIIQAPAYATAKLTHQFASEKGAREALVKCEFASEPAGLTSVYRVVNCQGANVHCEFKLVRMGFRRRDLRSREFEKCGEPRRRLRIGAAHHTLKKSVLMQ